MNKEGSGSCVVKKASEYRQHAAECLALARRAETDEQCKQFMSMADAWQRLASDRERFLQRHPELARVDTENAHLRAAPQKVSPHLMLGPSDA